MSNPFDTESRLKPTARGIRRGKGKMLAKYLDILQKENGDL